MLLQRALPSLALLAFAMALVSPALHFSGTGVGLETGFGVLVMGSFSWVFAAQGVAGIAVLMGWLANWTFLGVAVWMLRFPRQSPALFWVGVNAVCAVAGSSLHGVRVPSIIPGHAVHIEFLAGAQWWVFAHVVLTGAALFAVYLAKAPRPQPPVPLPYP